MARVTATEVKEIMLDTALTDAQIGVFIAVATDMVDDLDSDTTLGESRLALIERWLTAHLIASTIERMGTREKVGDAEITYMGEFGQNLSSTPYGQTAAMLDTSGTLKALGKKKITFHAITSFE
jgi:hypothetical protein